LSEIKYVNFQIEMILSSNIISCRGPSLRSGWQYERSSIPKKINLVTSVELTLLWREKKRVIETTLFQKPLN